MRYECGHVPWCAGGKVEGYSGILKIMLSQGSYILLVFIILTGKHIFFLEMTTCILHVDRYV